MPDVARNGLVDEAVTTARSSAPLSRRALVGSAGAGLAAGRPGMTAWDRPDSRQRSCITLWMNGGPSHIDTWDPKPGTPEGGPFRAIGTRNPDLRVCEHLPALADRAHLYSVVRGLTARDGNHRQARGALLGPVAVRLCRDPRRTDTDGHRWCIVDPARPGDPWSRLAVAGRLSGSDAAYGETWFGRACLLARRLAEVGVPHIGVVLDGWDTHTDNFARVAGLCRTLDAAMAALLDDLVDRGMLQRTLVVWMGDFGRTPRINRTDGRDHHPAASSVVLAGCGIRGGVVLGATDQRGERVVGDRVDAAALRWTVARLLGIQPLTAAEPSSPLRVLFA